MAVSNSSESKGGLRVRQIAVAVILLAILGATGVASSAPPPPITVLLDGVPLSFGVPPTSHSGRVMVPLRVIAESLGAEVTWLGGNHIAASGLGRTVELEIGSRLVVIDGVATEFEVAPIATENTTLVPVRFFADAFGAKVDWDQASYTVLVTSPSCPMHVLGFYAIRSFGERQLTQRFDATAFGWSRLDDQGRLTFTGRDFNWPASANEITPEVLLAETAASGGIRYLMVYAANPNGFLERFLTDDALVAQFVDDAVAAIRERGFDGLMLDFEGLGLIRHDGQRAVMATKFNALVVKLSEQLRAEGKLFSLAIHAPNSSFAGGYDYEFLAARVDELLIMAYDYHPAGVSGPEPVDLVMEAIELALAKIPREKLLLGISTWSETVESLAAKIGLAKRYRLKGIALWRLGLIGRQLEVLESCITLKPLPGQ